jgi:hypothetical protein
VLLTASARGLRDEGGVTAGRNSLGIGDYTLLAYHSWVTTWFLNLIVGLVSLGYVTWENTMVSTSHMDKRLLGAVVFTWACYV